MKAPEILIFDIDDTLVDTTLSYRGAIVATAAHFGVSLTNGDIARFKAQGNANNDWEVTRTLMRRNGVIRPQEEVTRVFESLYQGHGDSPGLKAQERLLLDERTLEDWATAFKLAIVTGRPRKDAIDVLHRFGIDALFGAIVTMDDGPLKPSPVPILTVLKTMKVSYGWMIGDTPDDVQSAVDAHIDAVGIIAPGDRGLAEQENARQAMESAGASMVLNAITELRQLLKPYFPHGPSRHACR